MKKHLKQKAILDKLSKRQDILAKRINYLLMLYRKDLSTEAK